LLNFIGVLLVNPLDELGRKEQRRKRPPSKVPWFVDPELALLAVVDF
jgi:hypothetical protein